MCTIKDKIFVLGGEPELNKTEDSAQIYCLELCKLPKCVLLPMYIRLLISYNHLQQPRSAIQTPTHMSFHLAKCHLHDWSQTDQAKDQHQHN